ncbi:MAG: 16S rRNA (adenine(1518)-N(6)/adenine(1519)-N(6))-dimethyltransferase RsmA [Candidatus Bilamarchaeum sp.]
MQRKKSLGQCFMEDRNILRLEAVAAGDLVNKEVLEIGPGDGRFSEILLEKNPKKLYLVEKDSRFAQLLKEKFIQDKRVEVIEGDILEITFPTVDVVFGNIPYYISSDIVFMLKDLKIDSAVLMVQKEFAQKMVQKTGQGNYGRLSVTSQLFFDIKMIKTVPKHLFRPMPRVDSAIILLKPTRLKITRSQEDVIRYLFSHKNKTVRNSLLDSKQFNKEQLLCLEGLAERRVKSLSKEECLFICDLLSKKPML